MNKKLPDFFGKKGVELIDNMKILYTNKIINEHFLDTKTTGATLPHHLLPQYGVIAIWRLNGQISTANP